MEDAMDGGRGLIFTEFNVARDVWAGFRSWHSDEHIAERLAVPGVRSARRYASTTTARHVCAYYRAETVEVFGTPAYQALFAQQSDATQRMTAGILNGTRFVGEIVDEDGVGYGGFLYRIRISAQPADDAAVAAWYDANAATLLDLPGIVRVLLASPRRELPNVSDPNWILLLEGYDPETLASVDQVLAGLTVSTHLFRLEHLIL
jgi:hypothetical protein